MESAVTQGDITLQIHPMSSVSIGVFSLNHRAPIGGQLLVWGFPFRSLGILT